MWQSSISPMRAVSPMKGGFVDELDTRARRRRSSPTERPALKVDPDTTPPYLSHERTNCLSVVHTLSHSAGSCLSSVTGVSLCLPLLLPLPLYLCPCLFICSSCCVAVAYLISALSHWLTGSPAHLSSALTLEALLDAETQRHMLTERG